MDLPAVGLKYEVGYGQQKSKHPARFLWVCSLLVRLPMALGCHIASAQMLQRRKHLPGP